MSKKKILIDILHPADINFFKNTIEILKKNNIDVVIIYRDRGKLSTILKKELPSQNPILIGKHYNSFLMKTIGLLTRSIHIRQFIKKNNFDLCTSFGFFVGTSTIMQSIPSILFGDDREYRLAYYISKYSGNYFILPRSIEGNGKNILHYAGFKELAYVHPNYFVPNQKSLLSYGLQPNKYVFIRDVSSNSMNYYKSKVMNFNLIIDKILDLGLTPVLSSENDVIPTNVKNKCILLKEPVHDIFSILSFALFSISSGDTMARESCLVGTPSIYSGKRNMQVNQDFISKNCMFPVFNDDELINTIDFIYHDNIKEHVKESIDLALNLEWDDTTQYMSSLLLDMIDKNNVG
ncbi:DUF354 domain-containing protein [Methanolobus vulcani]|uniref:DUF354 domain-containing protein n=1 Tax=Methanolobus vulcani TaxID=38026 RepID=A0A7Z8KPZ3_9EURY|nr:DUF354 domain-containing protein [Methanolobus vulcani]TQD27261.1 DUF354 domain-containing protein [Methanolobus vulcani]